ncbi:hypothetical protein D9753_31290 [Streptomyces dangxiongensis]|uniref:Uncharacterized protein n=1 Tax=Streptomyces dangxiongensis TaxID=1442032 RepID=A0A3G2JRJ3_9ACTN|nr:hypothetical protein D9753_31290 [Streptomyces dangxiongensis]
MEWAEIDRLRAQDGFPDALRERLRVMGTAEGAALMNISAGRFTRLARLGLLVPVKFYLNRYRAVVWLYLAEELREFAADAKNTSLLKGRTPESLRGQLAAGVDLRARNWRGRRLGTLLRQAEHPWARAGAVAAFLTPAEVVGIVRDPYERAYLNRFRPAPPGPGAPGTPSAEFAERIMTAQDADELGWLRSDLARAMEEARTLAPAPRPAARRAPPAIRAAARPIPPMTRTVTRPMEDATRFPGTATRSEHHAPRPPGPTARPSAPTTRPLGVPAHARGSATRPATRPPWRATRPPLSVTRPPWRATRPPLSVTRPSPAAARPRPRAVPVRPAAALLPQGHETRRTGRAAPPAVRRTPQPVPQSLPEAARPSRGLRAWLRWRGPRPARA